MSEIVVISNPESFWEEARWQRVCAVCGRAGGRPDFRGRRWHAHHVVSRQELRRLHRPEWDTRDALRLCTDCHGSMEGGGVNRLRIETAQLTDDNICFVAEVFGVAAPGWLDHHYTGADGRLLLHAREVCPRCQL